MDDAALNAHNASASRHPFRGSLGRQVPQLLHILQLKASITRQHRTLLEAAIVDKRRRNEEIIEQQRRQLVARQQNNQLAAVNTQTLAVDAMTDVSPAVATVSEPSPPQSTTASTSTTSSPLPAHSLPLLSPADMAAFTFPPPASSSPASLVSGPLSYYSESQMLSLLPSVLAVHLLHCGFSSFPRSAVAVLSEATIDFVRRAGLALRQSQDDSKARRKTRHRGGKRAEKGDKGDSTMLGRSWLTPRLLRSMGMSDVRVLQRFYERAIGRAGERIRQTEERLQQINIQLTREQSDTVLRMTVQGDSTDSSGGSGTVSNWLCEPFSPLRSFVQPPVMPSTPPPLEEEKVEEQPVPPAITTVPTISSSSSSSADSSSSAAMIVDAAPSESGESGSVLVSEQPTATSTSRAAPAQEIASITPNHDEQAATLPPLEKVDGSLVSQTTQPMLTS